VANAVPSRRLLGAVVVTALMVLAGCRNTDNESRADSPPPSPAAGQHTPGTVVRQTAPTGGVSGATSGHLPKGFGAGPPGHGLQRFYRQHVTWRSCGGGDSCANVWVPLNYNRPNAQAITLALKRSPAGDPAHREGSLFINPGGPGGSGIDYLSYVNLDRSITNRYDVVGFDPRGVGRSTPVNCVSDRGLDAYLASDPTPDTPAEVRAMQRLWAHFTSGCVKHSGPLLAHVSTVEVARDLDILRALVGDKKLNYFGASYGTYIGATYAALFPHRVRRMVLDGAVDPLARPHTTEIDQAAGFQQALDSYLRYCVRRSDCPLGNTVSSAQQRLIELFKQIDRHPLPTSSGRKLTEGLAFLGVIVPLYSRANWSYETSALRGALAGSGNTLLMLANFYADRNPNGTYQDNSMEVQPAVNCLDHPEHETLRQIEAGRRQFVRASPVFGPAAMWWPYACSNWPVKPSQPQPDYSAKGAPPIVVIGTTRDPATPYQQAVNLAHELTSGVLLSRNGDGHTAYSSGNRCIDSAVDKYVVTGQPPAKGTMC
jgi:pimeloyl-ACP methyl ester carboxylesterase